MEWEAIFEKNKQSIIGFAELGAYLLVAYLFASYYRYKKQFSLSNFLALFWFTFDAQIHLLMEGRFLWIAFTVTVEKLDHWLAYTWKEYGAADKRWLGFDGDVIALEIVTVGIVGPLCVLLCYAITTKANSHLRHFVQVVVCIVELYGTFITFGPEAFNGNKNLDLADPIHVWCHLFLMNGIWVVVPILWLMQSYNAMKKANFGPTHKKKKN